MSQLAENLIAFRDEQKRNRLIPTPIRNLGIRETWTPLMLERASLYTLQVTWKSTASVSDLLPGDQREVALRGAIERAQRAAVEQVFGEFRKPLYEALIALDNYDYAEAKQILIDLGHQMFDIP